MAAKSFDEAYDYLKQRDEAKEFGDNQDGN